MTLGIITFIIIFCEYWVCEYSKVFKFGNWTQAPETVY